MTPPALEHVVRTCLRKEPEDRWQTAHDLFLQLEWITAGGTQVGIPAPVAAHRKKREKLSWLLLAFAALLVLAMAVPTFLYFRGKPAPDEIRFLVTTPNMPNPYFISISPDGRLIAFVASSASSGAASLIVRQIGSTAIQQLAGTEFAQQPFWSPDSRSIGFFSNGKMKRVDVSGGAPQNICDLNGSGTWNNDGIILFNAKNILYRVAAAGGDPTPVTSLNQSNHETSHGWPYFLPDDRHFLFTVWSDDESNRAIYVGSLDSKETSRLISAASMAVYASGFVFYQRAGTLFAQDSMRVASS
jgi:hypothetical protein